MSKTETFDVILAGSFKTVTPFTFTEPDLSKNKNGPTPKLPTIGGSLYIPSSSIRGSLRRLARDEVLDLLSEVKGEEVKLSLADFYLNTLGGVKSAKKDGDDEGEDKGQTARVAAGRKLNPLVSLFGAMAPAHVPGKIAVDHGIETSKAEALHIRHVRTNDFARDPDGTADMLQGGFEAEYLKMANEADLRSALNSEIKELNRQKKAAKTQEEKDRIQNEINEREGRKKKEASMVQVSQPLDYYAIPPEMTLKSGFRLMKVTRDELILFLRALDRFAANPVLGGRRNLGNGVVSASWDVRIRHGGAKSTEPAGTISFDGDFGPAKFTGMVAELAAEKPDLSGCDFSAKVFAEEK